MASGAEPQENISNNPKLNRVPKIPEDRYQVLEILGSGGMGVVLKATHVHLNKPVAIKVLNTTNVLDEASIKRFELEAKAGSQLSHPNLVAVFDYGITDDGEPFLVMEYVEGKSLWDIIDDVERLPRDTFLTIFKQIAKAVDYIHSHNIVHRDIKTSNIMIHRIQDDIYAKLLDFGIAKVLADEGLNLTATGTAFGSPLYMSPENCLGKEIDTRSDIYSFGCVMYECMAGKPPLIGENVMQTIQKQISELPELLPELKSGDPSLRSIARIIHKCIEKDPDNRFQKMSGVIQELSNAAEEANLSTHSLTVLKDPGPRMTRWTKTRMPAQKPPNELLDTQSEQNVGTLKGDPSLVDTSQERPPQLAEAQTSQIKSTETHQESPSQQNISTEKLDASRFQNNSTAAFGFLKPETFAVAAILVIAGIFFTSPFVSQYYQQFAVEQNLESAERLYKNGKRDWLKAEPYYEKALKYAAGKKDIITMGLINNRLGRINLNQGKPLKAKEHYSQAIEQLDQSKNENKEVYIESLIGMANCLSHEKQYKETEEYLNEALDLAGKWDMGPMKLGDILTLAAENYSTSSKRVQYAVSYYDHAIKEYEKLEDKPYDKLASAWISSAELSASMHWLTDTKRRLNQALDVSSKSGRKTVEIDVEKRAEALKQQLERESKQTPVKPPPPASPKKEPKAEEGISIDIKPGERRPVFRFGNGPFRVPKFRRRQRMRE